MKTSIDPNTGLLNTCEFITSPNFDDRPQNAQVDLIVIHNISLPAGKLSGPYINDLFLNRFNTKAHPSFVEISNLKVSCHCLIRRDGKIIQYVPFTKRAWHAGVSAFQGREKCNDYSIGIELEGADNVPYTVKQYKSLIKLLNLLMAIYKKVTLERIVGHSTIAPGRKTDPGPAFDWQRLFAELKGRLD